MRRSDREVTNINDICKIIDKCQVCRLAMNNNGYPYIVPMNFGYALKDGKVYLYFHGANAGTKKELIEKDGRVAFEMDVNDDAQIKELACNSTMDFESVCGVGKASIVQGETKEEILGIIMKQYTDMPFHIVPAMVEKTMVVMVEAEEITGKIHK